MDGNLSPAKDLHSLLLHNDLKHRSCLPTLKIIGRKEEHPDRIASPVRKCHTFLLHYFLEEFVRDLCQDSDTVTGLALCILTGPML